MSMAEAVVVLLVASEVARMDWAKAVVQMVDPMAMATRAVAVRVHDVSDRDRLATALTWFLGFLRDTERIPFVDPDGAGGFAYNQKNTGTVRGIHSRSGLQETWAPRHTAVRGHGVRVREHGEARSGAGSASPTRQQGGLRSSADADEEHA